MTLNDLFLREEAELFAHMAELKKTGEDYFTVQSRLQSLLLNHSQVGEAILNRELPTVKVVVQSSDTVTETRQLGTAPAAEAPASPVEDPPMPHDEPADEPSVPTKSKEEVSALLAKARAERQVDVVAILRKHGVKKLSDLPATEYDAVLKEAGCDA